MAGGIGGLPSSGLGGAARWRPGRREGRDNAPPGTSSMTPAVAREAVMPVRESPIPFEVAVARGRALRELPAAERPRERLQLRGAAGLTAAELIALLWGS